jgi:plasmid stabilization system protein ParE
MKFRYTEPAADELQRSVAYFREHAPASAADFADSVDDAVAQLLINPLMAQETEKPGIRRGHIRRFKYSIFYVVDREEVVILHIRHAARRWPWEDSN